MPDHRPILHPAGDNYSSFTPEEHAIQALEDALEAPRKRWGEISDKVGNVEAVTIADDTKAENVTTVIASIQALIKRVDSAHDTVKEPYLNAGRRVDAMTNVLRERIIILRDRLQAKLTAYQVEKQRQIDAERQAVRQQEAEDPEPGWQPPTTRGRHRIRSVEGATAHLTSTVDIEITDVAKIPWRYLMRPKVLLALRAEILPDVRKGDVVEGVKKIEGLESRVKT